MRQITSALTIAILLLLSATFVVDGRKTEMPSLKKSTAHNAKRVRAKLHHLSAAHGSLERHMQRLRKSAEPPLTESMKKSREVVAKRNAELSAKVGDVQSRAMAQQQNNQQKGPPKPGVANHVEQFFEAPHCKPATKYGVLQTRFHDVCARMDFSFVSRHWYSKASAAKAYENFCTSACAGSINDLLTFTDGYTCMPSDMLEELRLFSAMCQKSPQTQPDGTAIRCGADVATSGVFEGTADACMKHQSGADCRKDTTCEWDKAAMFCSEKVTEESMKKECNDCFLKIVGVVSNEFRSICAKRNGKFCLPKVYEFYQIQGTSASDTEAANKACAVDDLIPCFRALEVGRYNSQIANGRAAYTNCVDYALKWKDSFGQTITNSILASCIGSYYGALQAVEIESTSYSAFCSKNSTTAPSSYCIATAPDYTDAYNYCPTYTTKSGCATWCEADNARWVSELGCCAPYTQTYKLSAMDFPVLENGFMVTDADLSWYNGFLLGPNTTKVEECSMGKKVATLKQNDDAGCPNPFAVGDEIKFDTILNFTAFDTATAYQRDLFFHYLKLDIGKAAGVIATAINVMLEKSDMGTMVKFTIMGDKQLRDDAKKLWDDGEATRVLKWTDKFLSQCRECKPLTEASIIPRTFETIPDAPEDPCNKDEFYVGYQKMIAACSSTAVEDVFSTNTSTIQAANGVWNKACESECLAEFKKLKSGAYKTCVPTEVSTLGDLVNAGCQYDNATKANPNRCGAVLSVMVSIDCYQFMDKDSCGAATQCAWKMEGDYGMCRETYTKDFLQPLCDGGCISKLAATIGMNGDSFGKEAKLLDNLFCSKDEGELCVPLIQDDVDSIMGGYITENRLKGICGTKASGGQKLRCMKRVFSAVAIDTLQFAEEDFYSCVETVLDDSTVEHYNKAYQIEYTCIQEGLASIIASVDNTASMLNNMCSRNKDDTYCLSYVEKYWYGTSAEANCTRWMLDDNTCESACVSKIETALKDMGCCTGNIQEVYGFLPFGLLPEEYIPDFEVFEDFGEDVDAPPMERKQIERDTKGPQDASAAKTAGLKGHGYVEKMTDFQLDDSDDFGIDSPKWFMFSNYATCPSADRTMNPGNLVYKKCKKRRGTKSFTKTLDLGVSYETVHATPKKSKRFAQKLTGDLSVKVGMSGDDFKDGLALKKNEKKSINIKGPNRRTTTTSATSSSVNMNTESDTDTESSSSSYDTHVSSGTLTLSSTSALVKNECSNCTDANADHTSVSTTSTSVSLTTEAATGSSSSGGGLESSSEGSGAAATAFVAAVVSMVVAAVALF